MLGLQIVFVVLTIGITVAAGVWCVVGTGEVPLSYATWREHVAFWLRPLGLIVIVLTGAAICAVLIRDGEAFYRLLWVGEPVAGWLARQRGLWLG